MLNKYTPPAIYHELKWARGVDQRGGFEDSDADLFIYEIAGSDQCIDLNLPGYTPVTRNRCLERRREIFDIFKQAFSSSHVVITLGYIEVWFYRKRNIFVQQMPFGKNFNDLDDFSFARLPYEPCLRYLEATIDLLLAANPNVKILITTSPVPLARTYSGEDVITANMYSKSVLRAVAGRLAESHDCVDYFPSFESVTQTKSWDVWDDDKIHVTDQFVGKVVKRLIAEYMDVDSADASFHDFYTAYSEKRFDDAADIMKRMVDGIDPNPDYQAHYARCLLQVGDIDGSMQQIEAAIAAGVGKRIYNLIYSEILEEVDRPDDAIAQLKEYINASASNDEALWMVQQVDAAAAHFRIGNLQKSQGLASDALESFTTAAEMRRDLYAYSFAMATELHRLKRTHDAISLLENRNETYPGHAGYKFALARLYEQAGMLDQARQSATESLALNPTFQAAAVLLKRISV